MDLTTSSPEAVVQRQLDAYNATNLEAWLATYAPGASQYELPGRLIVSGRAEIRRHEMVTRTFPEGPGTIELVCVYIVEDGLMQSGSFHFGQPVVTAAALPGAGPLDTM